MTTPSPRTVVESASGTIDPDAQARHATDGELSARFQRDVKPLREPLYPGAVRVTRNYADADDLVQDTLMKAYAYLWHLILVHDRDSWGQLGSRRAPTLSPPEIGHAIGRLQRPERWAELKATRENTLPANEFQNRGIEETQPNNPPQRRNIHERPDSPEENHGRRTVGPLRRGRGRRSRRDLDEPVA